MKKYDDNLIALIRIDNENGKSISELSDIYGVPTGTIKMWRIKYGWNKKYNNHMNIKNQPTNHKQLLKDIEVKKDILDGKSKEDIMEKYGIGKSTYYNKRKSIRITIKEQSEKILKDIRDYAYPDGIELLKKIKGKKRNLMVLNFLKNCILLARIFRFIGTKAYC